MKRKNRKITIALLVCSFFATGCAGKKNPLENTIWSFVYNDSDYTIFSFSEFYFAITDYRIKDDGKNDYYEVSGSYTIKNNKLILAGETGKMSIGGEIITNSFLKKGWDGEYEFCIAGNDLVLTRENASVTLTRTKF